jgi:hypothetical protein
MMFRKFNGKTYKLVNDFARHEAAERAAGNGNFHYNRIVPGKGGWLLYQREKPVSRYGVRKHK